MIIINNPSGNSGSVSSLPNGVLINGVCYINQTTKPTTRPDSSALVVGDRWLSPSTNIDAFWNGTYWLSPTQQITTIKASGGSGGAAGVKGNSTSNSILPIGQPIFIDKVTYSYFISGSTVDTSNFYTLRGGYAGAASGAIVIPEITIDIKTTGAISGSLATNLYQANAAGSNAALDFTVQVLFTGSPTGGSSLGFSYYFRQVY